METSPVILGSVCFDTNDPSGVVPCETRHILTSKLLGPGSYLVRPKVNKAERAGTINSLGVFELLPNFKIVEIELPKVLAPKLLNHPPPFVCYCHVVPTLK
jgi:hypothetical protein